MICARGDLSTDKSPLLTGKRLTNPSVAYTMLLLKWKIAWIRTSSPVDSAQRAAHFGGRAERAPGEYPLGAGSPTAFRPVDPPGCDRYITRVFFALNKAVTVR